MASIGLGDAALYKDQGFLERLVEEKPDFRANRWRCLTDPVHATETLGPIAKLEITVVTAHNLVAWTNSGTFESPSRPYVKAFLNDRLVFETQPKRSSVLRWMHKDIIEFAVLQSMVRLEVLDYDRFTHQANIGFVECCVGELPWSQTLEGWMELRFYDRLDRTSYERYNEHCSARDDKVVDEVRQSLLREGGIMCCSNGANGFRRNAGEILVRMRLVRTGSWLDMAFALALDPPPPQDFGFRRLHPKDEKPGTQVQDLGDHLTDLKLAIVDGAVASTINFVGYILRWRSFVLSTLVSVALVGSWLAPQLAWVLMPALVAILLALLASKHVRREMTLGGLNAPLTQEGFEYVAAWRSTESMVRFLRRIVENDLQGKVISGPDLSQCAAYCFSDGKPSLTFETLREELKTTSWTTSTKDNFAAGALVVVDGEEGPRTATVRSAESHHCVRVRFDGGRESVVDRSRVTTRLLLPTLPEWILPEHFSSMMRELEQQVKVAKERLLRPVLWLSQVLAWRRPYLCCTLVVALLTLSAVEAAVVTGVWGAWPGQVQGGMVGTAKVVMGYIKRAAHWGGILLGVLILVHESPWFTEVRGVQKICWRLLCSTHGSAPKRWAFFTPGSERQATLLRHFIAGGL